MKALPRIRLLPLVIFAAVLMLGVRIGEVVRALSVGAAVEAVQPTLAQGPAAPPSTAPPPNAKAPPPAPAAGRPAADAAAPPVRMAAAQPPPAATGQEGGFGTVQAEMVQRLAERREELDRRARELDQREALLAAAEQRIDQKINELRQLRSNIEGLLKTANEQQQAQLESLVKIYETMKPKEAARIFENLEMPVLLNVMERMKEGKTALILAAMDPLKAKEITTSLADRRQIPSMPQ